jgi:hypothetical protein
VEHPLLAVHLSGNPPKAIRVASGYQRRRNFGCDRQGMATLPSIPDAPLDVERVVALVSW